MIPLTKQEIIIGRPSLLIHVEKRGFLKPNTAGKAMLKNFVKKLKALKKAVRDCYNHMTNRTPCKGDWIKKTNELNNKIKELIK